MGTLVQLLIVGLQSGLGAWGCHAVADARGLPTRSWTIFGLLGIGALLVTWAVAGWRSGAAGVQQLRG